MILVDAKYYGSALNAAQRQAKIKYEDLERIMNTPRYQLRKYFRGTAIIPKTDLINLMLAGLQMIAFRHNMAYRKNPQPAPTQIVQDK